MFFFFSFLFFAISLDQTLNYGSPLDRSHSLIQGDVQADKETCRFAHFHIITTRACSSHGHKSCNLGQSGQAAEWSRATGWMPGDTERYQNQPARIPFASQPAGELLSPEPSQGFVIRRSKSKFHRNPAQPLQPKRSRFGTQVLSTPPNSTAPGKNVEACRRINKYLLFNQQYFDWGCKHGPMPVKPEPSWPALQTNFFFCI